MAKSETRSRRQDRSAPLLRLMHEQTRKADLQLDRPTRPPMRVAGLFAGIGGIELGLRESGHETEMFCEIDAGAQAVLKARFKGQAPVHDDICTLQRLPRHVELVTAGFPCQDLSQAGKTVGIAGARSGLIGEVFRLLERRTVPWVLIENVPFMLQLSRGRALEVIISALEFYGYKWAYRIVDARAFGIPQRRRRVFILASLEGDPRDVLLADDVGEAPLLSWGAGRSFGFYWTEGVRGLGAAVDAVPTLKGGSAVGIPSPPAIVLPDGRVIVPDIRDAERLQGFAEEWTAPAEGVLKRGYRWKYVGNAVAVPAARWIGQRLRAPGAYWPGEDNGLQNGEPWPDAAWNIGAGRHRAFVSAWPVREPMVPIHDFLRHPGNPLSIKATAGFLRRAQVARLNFPDGFLAMLRVHLEQVSAAPFQATRRAAG